MGDYDYIALVRNNSHRTNLGLSILGRVNICEPIKLLNRTTLHCCYILRFRSLNQNPSCQIVITDCRIQVSEIRSRRRQLTASNHGYRTTLIPSALSKRSWHPDDVGCWCPPRYQELWLPNGTLLLQTPQRW